MQGYPYVVIRWVAAVYGRRPVSFASPLPGAEGYFLSPGYLDSAGMITEEGRTELERLVLADVKDTRLRMCVVYGPKDCVFIEPDGSLKTSESPPSGGVRMDQVRVRTGN